MDYPIDECIEVQRNKPGFYAGRANQDDRDQYLGAAAEFDYNNWGGQTVDSAAMRSVSGSLSFSDLTKPAPYEVVSAAGTQREG